MTAARFSVDGEVSEAKVRELLAVGHELDVLDYKRQLDLGRDRSNDKARVEFAKDAAALSSLPTGGYIVVGADGHGRPATDAVPLKPEHFDEAQLRQILQSYLEGALQLACRTHDVDGWTFALIYVGPARDGLPPVMKRDGEFLDDQGRARRVFPRGAVFVRDGTISRQVQHGDWTSILTRYRQLIRDQALVDLQRTQPPGRAATPSIDVQLPIEDFETMVDAALDAGRDAALRTAIHEIRRGRRGWSDPERSAEVADLLDRAVAIAALALRHRQLAVFTTAVDAIGDFYLAALDHPGTITARDGLARAAGVFWRDIAARMLALLAAVVRERAWEYVRPVVLRPIGPEAPHGYRSWFRHAITQASISGALSDSDGTDRPGPLIYFARTVLRAVPALHAGVPDEEVQSDPSVTPEPSNGLLDSLCQADFLWCVLVVAESPDSHPRHEFFPSCSVFLDRRTAAIANALVSDEGPRGVITRRPDGAVAAALLAVDALAGQQAPFGWSIMGGAVSRFVADHANWEG